MGAIAEEDAQLQIEFEPLVVLEVNDRFTPGLTERRDRRYRSPPQLRDHALMLAAMLLDGARPPVDGDGPWQRALAGGRRTVWIEETRGGL